MCLDICEPICVKLGMMNNNIELYNLVPVLRTLTFIQDHKCARKQRLPHILSHKVLN